MDNQKPLQLLVVSGIIIWKYRCRCAQFKVGETVIDGKVVEWDPYIHPTSVYYKCEEELYDHIDDCQTPDCPYKNMTHEQKEIVLPYWP